MKRVILIEICIMLIFTSILNVYALGVSPGRRMIDYNPGSIVETYINIHNSDGEERTVSILIKGELTPYISIETKTIEFKIGENIKTIPVKINIPLDLAPGRKGAVIEISEDEPTFRTVESSTTINARLQVLSFIVMDIPVTGKYASLNINIKPEETETVFQANIENIGNEDIKNANLRVQIYKDNVLIDELKSEIFALLKEERKEISLRSVLDGGGYRIISTLNYDDKKNILEQGFEIRAEEFLELRSLSVGEFSLGNIAKFEIGVGNIGDYIIKDLYGVMEIFDNKNNKIAEIRSDNVDLSPNIESLINIYWDTKDVREGKYESKITLLFGNRMLEKDLEIVVEREGIKTNFLTGGIVIDEGKKMIKVKPVAFIIVVFILIIIINIILFIRYKKRQKDLRIR